MKTLLPISASISKALTLTIAGTVLIALVETQEAQALTFTFSLGGSPEQAASFNYEVGGVGLKIAGLSSDGSNVNVIRDASGLGVINPGDRFDDPEVDGVGPDELLRLDFNGQQVVLVSATFSRIGFGDNFNLAVDDTLLAQNVAVDAATDPTNTSDDGVGTFDFTMFDRVSRTGTVFDFTLGFSDFQGGSPGNRSFTDDYFLTTIVVEPIPEPLTVGCSILFGGLMSVAAKKRLKSAK